MCRYALENITLEEYRYLDIQQVRHVCVGGTGEHHRGGAQISRQTAGDTSICWDAPDIEFGGYPGGRMSTFTKIPDILCGWISNNRFTDID